MNNICIPGDEIFVIMRRMLEFPFPQICRHLVVCDLISMLEKNGVDGSQLESLAKAVVGANDEEALVELKKLERKTCLRDSRQPR